MICQRSIFLINTTDGPTDLSPWHTGNSSVRFFVHLIRMFDKYSSDNEGIGRKNSAKRLDSCPSGMLSK